MVSIYVLFTKSKCLLIFNSNMMKIKLFVVFFFFAIFSFASNLTGNWKFDDPTNLLKASTGTTIELVGTHISVAGPDVTNGAVQINAGSYYKAIHGVPKNGGGNYVNEFTMMFDIYLPNKSNWKALYQANLYNSNDAECFIKPNGELGIASTGYTTYQLNEKEWYRVVISVDLGTSYKYYIDGQLAKEGTAPAVDGGFSLELDKVLLFADNNGEDGLINVAEISIWDGALNSSEVHNLGGYGHTIPSVTPTSYTIYPYLQSLTTNSVFISWHDTSLNSDKLDYSTQEGPVNTVQSSSETVTGNYYWHTIKLINLLPNTKYSYKIYGTSDTTQTFKFKTLPEDKDIKKLRFLLMSDTQDDPEKNKQLINAAKAQITTTYGADIQNQLTGIIHTGDIVSSGSTINQYTDMFFVPFSPLTSYVPTLITAGNHELEHQYYYKYVKNDDISAQPSTHSDYERYWSKKIGRVLLIGLNSTDQPSLQGIFTQQKIWLKNILDNAEIDETIDFVFCFVHAHPMSELWATGSIPFVKDQVLPLIKQYTKVQQLTYGHTHGYERGMLLNENPNSKGDITLLCNGGGGGVRDRWGQYTNINYPEIHTSLEQYFYTLCEIDLENMAYEFKVYGFGNNDVATNNVLIDSWYRKLNQLKPEKPTCISSSSNNEKIDLASSYFQGYETPFSSQFQVYLQNNDGTTSVILDKIRDVKDIYGATNFVPINLNSEIELNKFSFNKSILDLSKIYFWKVRYRDVNQKWSEWSEPSMVNLQTSVNQFKNDLYDVKITQISNQIKVVSNLPFNKIELIDTAGKKIFTKNNLSSITKYEISKLTLNKGVYFVKLDNYTKKIIL